MHKGTQFKTVPLFLWKNKFSDSQNQRFSAGNLPFVPDCGYRNGIALADTPGIVLRPGPANDIARATLNVIPLFDFFNEHRSLFLN